MSNDAAPAGTPAPETPLQALPVRLWGIVTALRVVVAAWGGRYRTEVPMVVRVWSRVTRIAQRFERLVAHLVAGTLPPPRVRVRTSPRAPYVRLPGRPAWLLRELREVAVFGYRLQALMEDPAMAALLESCPRAGRILRPLRTMLDVNPPQPRVRAAAPVAWWQTPPPLPPGPEVTPCGYVLFPPGRLPPWCPG